MEQKTDQINNRFADEIRILQSRILELEQWLGNIKSSGAAEAFGVLSPSVWTQERFCARITVDNEDGTYQARRLVVPGANLFDDDPDDTAIITVANSAERIEYSGMYSVGDIVCVYFEGLDSSNDAIYQIW